MTTEAEVFEELKLSISVSSYGTRRYRNAGGQLHRVGGPAVVWESGEQEWYQNNLRHREDGPAMLWLS